MKNDLISRKEVLEKLKYLEPFRKSATIFRDIYEVVNEIPARGEIGVEVGYWIPVPSDEPCYRCSKCQAATMFREDYCCKCGQKNYSKEVYDKLRK